MKRNKLILTPVEELPEFVHGVTQCDVAGTIEEFFGMDCKIVRVDFSKDNYTSVDSAKGAFNKALRDYGYPIKTSIRNGGLYLIKKDIT
jgi:hypothetical protein